MSGSIFIQEVSARDSRVVSKQCDSSTLQLIFPINPALVTNLRLQIREQASNAFKLMQLECMSTEQQMSAWKTMHEYEVPGMDLKPEFVKNEGYVNMVFPSVGLAEKVRVTLQVTGGDMDELDNEVAAIACRNEQTYDVHNFRDSIASFGVYGFSLFASPSSNHSIALLNLASFLRNDTLEADFLAGLSLMNSRRFVQAAEFIRRAESWLLQDLEGLPANSPRVLGSPPFKTSSGTTNKKLVRAAQMELLVAEGFNQHGQMFDKLIAYQKATEFYLEKCELGEVQLQSDAYSTLMKLQPHLGRLLLRNIGDKLEPLRLACIHGIEFLIEHLGCALGNQVPLALKCIIKTYPNSTAGTLDSFENSMTTTLTDYMNREEASQSLIDAYNRLLETVNSMLSSCSPHLLHQIFHEVISHYILLNEQPKELRLYMLRIADKITNICEGDLEYSVSLLSGILELRASEEVGEQAGKLWETVKSKIIPNFAASRLSGLVEWLCESLSGDTEYENPEIGTILEVVQLISAQPQSKNPLIRHATQKKHQLQPLLTPLLYWLDYAAANQERLPLFEQVWRCIVSLASHFKDMYLSRLILPLLHKAKEFCAVATPPRAMLQFLQIVFNDCKDQNPDYIEFLFEFLPVFAQCVPSSVQDDTFVVFSQVIKLIDHRLNDDLLRICVDTLLDQYTVKSSSQKQAKHNLVLQIIENPSQLYFIFCYSLFDNEEQLADMTRTDKQQLMTNHDFYIEKVSFAIEIIVVLLDSTDRSCFDYLDKFADACFRFLMSTDSHVRVRALEILRLLGELSLATVDELEAVGPSRISVSKLICAVIKFPLEQSNDSKISFYCLQLADLVFKHILPPPSEKAVDKKYHDIRFSEIFKLWGGVQDFVNSPWSNIRAISFSVICTWVQYETANPRQVNRMKQFLHPLLMNLLSSRESESRAGALNILGSFCGFNLGGDDSDAETKLSLQLFRTRAESVPISIWELVYHLQEDWDTMIREASTVLIQLCAPRESVRHFYRLQREECALKQNITRDRRTPGSLVHSTIDDDHKRSPAYPSAHNSFRASSSSEESFDSMEQEPSEELDNEDLFWIDGYEDKDILTLVRMFKNDARNPTQLWNEQVEIRDDDTKDSSKEEPTLRMEEEEESLEQLGVIDVEDEELLEGCDDEHNNFPVIKNHYAKRKGQSTASTVGAGAHVQGGLARQIEDDDEEDEDDDEQPLSIPASQKWSIRPQNGSRRASTPPAERSTAPFGHHDDDEEDEEDEFEDDYADEGADYQAMAIMAAQQASVESSEQDDEEPRAFVRPSNPTFDEQGAEDDDEEDEDSQVDVPRQMPAPPVPVSQNRSPPVPTSPQQTDPDPFDIDSTKAEFQKEQEPPPTRPVEQVTVQETEEQKEDTEPSMDYSSDELDFVDENRIQVFEAEEEVPEVERRSPSDRDEVEDDLYNDNEGRQQRPQPAYPRHLFDDPQTLVERVQRDFADSDSSSESDDDRSPQVSDLPQQVAEHQQPPDDSEEDTFQKFDKILQNKGAAAGTNQTDRPYRYDSEFSVYGKKPRTVSPPGDKMKAKTDRGITEWSKSYTKFKTMFGELEDYISQPRNN